MRLLKILFGGLLAVFALFAGVVAAAAVAIAGLMFVVGRNLFPKRGPSRLPDPGLRRTSSPARGEVIDVTATEVPSRSNDGTNGHASLTAEFPR